ncbi:MAG: hypothetical protein ACJAYB_002329 [Psychromonas sp.]|jgi:hypothetical protein
MTQTAVLLFDTLCKIHLFLFIYSLIQATFYFSIGYLSAGYSLFLAFLLKHFAFTVSLFRCHFSFCYGMKLLPSRCFSATPVCVIGRNIRDQLFAAQAAVSQ